LDSKNKNKVWLNVLKSGVPLVAGLALPYYTHGVLKGYEFLNDPNIGPRQGMATTLTIIGALLGTVILCVVYLEKEKSIKW
jgi:hypothetical protein